MATLAGELFDYEAACHEVADADAAYEAEQAALASEEYEAWVTVLEGVEAELADKLAACDVVVTVAA